MVSRRRGKGSGAVLHSSVKPAGFFPEKRILEYGVGLHFEMNSRQGFLIRSALEVGSSIQAQISDVVNKKGASECVQSIFHVETITVSSLHI